MDAGVRRIEETGEAGTENEEEGERERQPVERGLANKGGMRPWLSFSLPLFVCFSLRNPRGSAFLPPFSSRARLALFLSVPRRRVHTYGARRTRVR